MLGVTVSYFTEPMNLKSPAAGHSHSMSLFQLPLSSAISSVSPLHLVLLRCCQASQLLTTVVPLNQSAAIAEQNAV